MKKLLIFLCVLVSAGLSVSAWAAPFVMSNGPGGGTVSVGLDGYGAFGSSVGSDSSNAIYDPVGSISSAGTSYESGVAIRFGSSGGYQFLTSGAIGSSGGLTNPTITGTPLSGSTSFLNGGLSFAATYTLQNLVVAGSQTGSVLIQSYLITNTTSQTIDFDLIRYLDGDLVFDGSIQDGGGRLFSGGTEILFETDSATGSADATTFVGITGEGGTIPGANRYEIDSFSGLRSRIIAGTALDDAVAGDGGDADQFIDTGSGYDITLALRNVFSLSPNASGTYTTRTIFGSGAPDEVPPPAVPEPATMFLLGSGLIGLAGFKRKKRS